MKEAYEPSQEHEFVRLDGPRGFIVGFDEETDQIVASLTSSTASEVRLRAADYVRVSLLKSRPDDGFRGDQLSYEEMRQLYESDTGVNSKPFNAIILERDLFPVEKKHFFTARWGLIYLAKPRT